MSEHTAPDVPPGTEVPGGGQASDAERRDDPKRRAAEAAEIDPELRDLSGRHPQPGEQPPAAH